MPPRICARDSGAICSRTNVPCVRSVTRLMPNDIMQPISPQMTPCGNVMSNALSGPRRSRATAFEITFSGCHCAAAAAGGLSLRRRDERLQLAEESLHRRRLVGWRPCMSPSALSTMRADAAGS